MSHVLVTGGSGFFGGVLKRRLLAEGFTCVSVDLLPDSDRHPDLVSIEGDLRDASLLGRLFSEHTFTAVFHYAAMLAHKLKISPLGQYSLTLETYIDERSFAGVRV
jgi:nucleoside-diphosphate-sugar epimerase